jgi:hypothetical protein
VPDIIEIMVGNCFIAMSYRSIALQAMRYLIILYIGNILTPTKTINMVVIRNSHHIPGVCCRELREAPVIFSCIFYFGNVKRNQDLSGHGPPGFE